MNKSRKLDDQADRGRGEKRSRYVQADRLADPPTSKRSRHLEVLAGLLKYRYLSADDIAQLLDTGYAHRRVLTTLYHAGLVERRHIHTPPTRLQQGSPPAVYLLTPKGLKEWAQASDVDLGDPSYTLVRKRVAARARPKEGESEHTRHAWALARFQRCLDRSAEAAGLSVERFVADREEGMPNFTIPVPRVVKNPDASSRKSRPYVTQGAPWKLKVLPDGAFRLRNGRGEERVFILEVDNARRKPSRSVQRALAYWTLISQGREALEKALDATTVDVVFVSPTERRRERLRELTLQTPKLKRGALFWFIALPDLLQEENLSRAGDTVSRVWTVPGDRLFMEEHAITVKLDGTPSPLGLRGFLTASTR
jgi:hypothetical protein